MYSKMMAIWPESGMWYAPAKAMRPGTARESHSACERVSKQWEACMHGTLAKTLQISDKLMRGR